MGTAFLDGPDLLGFCVLRACLEWLYNDEQYTGREHLDVDFFLQGKQCLE